MAGTGDEPAIVIFCLVFLLVFSSSLYASSDFIWPLQRNYGVSATFGESRNDHYHAGIDLSTNGETGLPVLAVADGSIYRMKIQKRAYGKALYIQHSNGTQSVYAHLEGYSEQLGLQQLYRNKAARIGTPYVGDIFVDPPIRVKQGQVVAYSGESGAGLPHLHLEIRKNETVIINPLVNGLRDTMDPIPPTFQAAYFYPLTHDSAINGDLETTEVRLRKSASLYKADSHPVVRGDFAVSVSVYDSALRPYHRTPHKLIYSIDDKELYSIEIDQFSYTEPQGFGLFYDLGKPGPSYYEHPIFLSGMANFRLPFVKRSVPFSATALAPGMHRLKIEAIDTNKNSSTAEISFIVNHPPSFEIQSIQDDASALVIHSAIRDRNWTGSGPLSAEVEYSLDDGNTFKSVPSTSLDPGQKDALHFRYRVPFSEIGNSKRVLIRARAYDGIEYSPYVFAKAHPGEARIFDETSVLPAGNLRYEAYRGAIRIIYDAEEPVTGKFQASVGEPPASYPLHLWSPNSLTAIIPAPGEDRNLIVALPGGQSLTVPVNFAKAGTRKSLSTENAGLMLHENSLYQDSWIWAKSMPQYSSKTLPVVAPILQLGPRGLPFKKDATLTLSFPATVQHPEKLSIYRWNRTSQKWSSLPSKVNTGAQTVQTKIEYLDLYALIYDNVPPRISSIFPKRRSSTRNQSPVLAVHIQDSGMDVDDEKVTFYVDGVPYIAEYDPDRNTATAKVTGTLKKGYHKFYAVAYDYAGNKTQSPAVTFQVK